MLTNQQIDDICILSKDCIHKRMLCETIQNAMKKLNEDCNQVMQIEIGQYKIQLTKGQKPIISILLQSIMATRVQEMDECNENIIKIAQNDRSGADSVNQIDP